MNCIIEPNFWAKMKMVTENKTGKAYNDWRAEFVGKEGSLSFRYYGKNFEFDCCDEFDELGNEINRERFWSSAIERIEETGNELRIRTDNSEYAFEVIKKIPNEDTSAYYARLTNKE